MTRRLPTKEEVARLGAEFGRGEGATLLADASFKDDLHVTLRVTLLTSFALESIGEEPCNARDDLDMLRDDIHSGIDSFEHVALTVASLSGIAQAAWVWRDSLSWSDVREGFREELRILTQSQTPLVDRYTCLVRLIRYELLIWSHTFGLTAQGFIR